MFRSRYTLYYASMNAEYPWHPISFSRGPSYLGRRSKQHSGHIELRLLLSAIAFAIREWTEIDWELFSQVNPSLLHCHLISHTEQTVTEDKRETCQGLMPCASCKPFLFACTQQNSILAGLAFKLFYEQNT